MSNNNQPSFLGYLHSFRGFAILNIVAIHAIVFAIYDCNDNNFNPKDPYSIANELLFHNSTIYFSVISGLLFSVVLNGKGYRIFYRSKLKNVLLPYLFLTLLFSIFNPSTPDSFDFHTDFMVYLNGAILNFIYGKAQFPYWYIPILFFLYLITPLLEFVMKIERWGTMLMILIVLLPLGISRVELLDMLDGQFLSLSTMIYFTGAYAAGMYFGVNPEERFKWVSKNMFLIVLITILSSLAIVYFEIKEIDKFGSWSLRGTLFYIQKVCLSGIFIMVFKSLGERQPRWLGQIANYAFSIYFLHVFFLEVLYGLVKPIANLHQIAPLNLFLVSLIFLTLSIAFSLLSALVFKKFLGKYSRMLVGS